MITIINYIIKNFEIRSSPPLMAQIGGALKFSGHQYLRQRLVLSILSGKYVKIDKIRTEDKNPGLRGTFGNSGFRLINYLVCRF